MEFLKPSQTGFTIYSKSGCPNCTKAKQLLHENVSMEIINCDEYLLEDKEGFLQFIKELAGGIDHRTFPIVFHETKFIGGYKELDSYYSGYCEMQKKNLGDEVFELSDF